LAPLFSRGFHFL